MSPSVLYLAIIAIWALFLVPAWLRRGHAARGGSEVEAAYDADPEAYPQDQDDLEAGSDAAQMPLAGRGDRPGDPVEFEEDDAIGWEEAPAGPVRSATRYEVTFEDDYAPGGYYEESEPRAEPEPAERASRTGADGAGLRPAAGLGSADGFAMPAAAQRLAQAGRSPQNRQQMLRARRRMLTMLVLFTLAAAGATGAGLLPWWAVVPPAGMLFIYLLLLREIAMAEAEMTARHRHALAAAHKRAGARAAYESAQPPAPEPTAEIIDISSRVGDQLYDQYADAAVRAVGD